MSQSRPTAEEIERLLIGLPPRHTRAQVAAEAGVPAELAARIWRALGFAARLTAIAKPGTILANPDLAEGLEGLAGFEVRKIRHRPARGLGVVQPYVLRRSSS